MRERNITLSTTGKVESERERKEKRAVMNGGEEKEKSERERKIKRKKE